MCEGCWNCAAISTPEVVSLVLKWGIALFWPGVGAETALYTLINFNQVQIPWEAILVCEDFKLRWSSSFENMFQINTVIYSYFIHYNWVLVIEEASDSWKV